MSLIRNGKMLSLMMLKESQSKKSRKLYKKGAMGIPQRLKRLVRHYLDIRKDSYLKRETFIRAYMIIISIDSAKENYLCSLKIYSQ